MKQFIPFVLIAFIVGGAMLFLNDSYEEEVFEPISSSVSNTSNWVTTFFINEASNGNPEIGIKFEHVRDDIELDAFEFFVETMYGGFYYQDLDMEQFDGVITHAEECDFCELIDSEEVYVNVTIHWREKDIFIRTDYLHFNFPAEDFWSSER